MPYLYGAAVEVHRTGVPVMRPMVLEFPHDPACRTLDRQYMLGPDLLVAPVFSEDGAVEVYLPEGTWTHLLSGERVTGPAWRTEHHGYDSLPLYVREGAVLPLAADDQRPDGDWLDGPTLLVHPPASPDYTHTVTVPDLTGAPAATYEVRRDGDTLRVTAHGTDAPFTVRVPGGASAEGTGEVTVPLD
jgi:alpha-D-xyloside xylohydrolase